MSWRAGSFVGVRALALLTTVTVAGAAWPQAPDERHGALESVLRAAGYSRDKGRIHWTFALSTGHLGSDPALARAAQDEVRQILERFAAPFDRVEVAGFEMTVWTSKGPVDLPEKGWWAEVQRLMPTTPAPSSKGGRDILRALATVSERPPKGRVLVAITPGPSQLPRGGEGSLISEGSAEFRKVLAAAALREPLTYPVVADHAGGRNLWVTVLAPERLTAGSEPRKKLEPAPPKAGVAPSRNIARGGGVPAWLVVVLVLGCSTVAYALAARRRPGEEDPQPEPSAPAAVDEQPADDPEPPAKGTPEADTMPRALIHTLDAISQDLAETVNSHAEAIAALKANVLEVGALRQEVVRKEAEVDAWIDAAIAFLDAAHRASTMQDVTPERRETWAKAAQSFARRCARNGLDVIDPKPGDPVVAGLHVIEEFSDAEPGVVSECLVWGFRTGSRVIRPAKVAAGKPLS